MAKEDRVALRDLLKLAAGAAPALTLKTAMSSPTADARSDAGASDAGKSDSGASDAGGDAGDAGDAGDGG